DGALASRQPCAGQAALAIQRAKWTPDLVERVERGGRLVRRAPYRQSGGVRDVIPESPAHRIPRRRQRGRSLSQQGTRRVKKTRAERGSTRDRGTDQWGSSRHLGTLLVHALCHLEAIRHL